MTVLCQLCEEESPEYSRDTQGRQSWVRARSQLGGWRRPFRKKRPPVRSLEARENRQFREVIPSVACVEREVTGETRGVRVYPTGV